MTDSVITMGDDCTLFLGDCLDVLKTLPSDSVDAIVTDPPAGIGFMGKDWDHHKGGRKQWIAWMTEIASECLRVLKPGGHALVWAIPRTSHWTATAWEKAGFEIRDRIAHIFGSGFPKSADVSKMIDKLHGAEREVVGKYQPPNGSTLNLKNDMRGGEIGVPTGKRSEHMDITAPASDQAKQWQGWGTALKPAMEDWWLCRKPLEGTVAANVLKHGVGGLNVDGCRVGSSKSVPGGRSSEKRHCYAGCLGTNTEGTSGRDPNIGRFPANLIHDGSDEVVAMFPATEKAPDPRPGGVLDESASKGLIDFKQGSRATLPVVRGDCGSAARFFYCAKTSQEDRDEGCEGLLDGVIARSCQAQAEAKRGNVVVAEEGAFNKARLARNHHPTVKPTELMRYLCRLITPPGGILIDPFMGSGSTGKASMLEGFRFIGIEREPDYFAIAEARIRTAQQRAFDARRQQVIDLEPAPEKPVSQPAIQPALPLEAAA